MSELTPIWKKKFLVVDDDEAVCNLLSRMLARQGTVETASNGAEALEKVKTQFFDAIISDVKMPVMDGLEFFIEAISEDPSLSARFVFCTSQLSPEGSEFLERYKVRCVFKPFSLEEINQVIDEVVERHTTNL